MEVYMKKILLTVLCLLAVVTALSVCSAAVMAQETDADEIPQILSLPDGQNYAFYAQTRIGRYDLSKYDIRILCVVNQAWFEEIDNFVATFTFTDGTTPISLKKVGFNTVFQSITALGKSGTVDHYIADEGTLLLGMIITNVPAAYADLNTNKPTYTVVTDNSVKAEITPPAIDYETPVESMTDLNVMTDGVVYFANKQDDGQIGTWRRQNNYLLTSKATYILNGNYEGYYDLTVTYTDTDGYNIAVIVNDTLFVIPITGSMKTSSWNVGDAKKATITVPMIKGANVITFTAVDWASANLIDFDLHKNESYTPDKTYTQSAADTPTLSGVAKTVACYENGIEVGKLVQLANQSDTKIGSASYSLNGVEKGKYLLVMEYLTSHNDREFHVWVDNQASQKIKVINCQSDSDLANLSRAAIYVEIPENAEALNFRAYDWELGLYRYSLIRVSDEITEIPDTPKPDVDYETPVLVKNDVNVATDGVVSGAEIQDDDQIGQMRDKNNASATYILSGNYEGYYDLTITYTDTDGYLITVSVNGKHYSIPITSQMTTSSWKTADAKSVTITVPMIKGDNVISFTAPAGTWSPNLVDFDLVKNETYNPESIPTQSATDATLDGAQLEACVNSNGVEVGKNIGYLGNGGKATFDFEAPADGKYMLVIHYLTNANGRKFNISLDGGTATAYTTTNCGSNVDITNIRTLIICYDLTQGTHSFTFGGKSDWNPNINSVSLVPVN